MAFIIRQSVTVYCIWIFLHIPSWCHLTPTMCNSCFYSLSNIVLEPTHCSTLQPM